LSRYTNTLDTYQEKYLPSIVGQNIIRNGPYLLSKKNEVLKWPGIDSQDLLTYRNGKTYKREIIEWKAKESFSLLIGEIDRPKSLVKWQFEDNKKNIKVKITVYPHLLINWPKFSSYLPYKCYISPKLRRYLRAVLCGLKHHAESGEKSQESQVARHPWFS